MPLEASSFPRELQVAFFVYDKLTDVWEGMSGSYMGKNWQELSIVCDVYNLKNDRNLFTWLKEIDKKFIVERAERAERERKLAEKKAKAARNGNSVHEVRND